MLACILQALIPTWKRMLGSLPQKNNLKTSKTTTKTAAFNAFNSWYVSLMIDFAARDSSDFRGLVAKNVAANFALLVKAVEVSLNDVKGEWYSTYWLKYLELCSCTVCFSAQRAPGLRFWMIAKKIWNAKTVMSVLGLTFRRYFMYFVRRLFWTGSYFKFSNQCNKAGPVLIRDK